MQRLYIYIAIQKDFYLTGINNSYYIEREANILDFCNYLLFVYLFIFVEIKQVFEFLNVFCT